MRLSIGCLSEEVNDAPFTGDEVRLLIEAEEYGYHFYAISEGTKANLGYADSKYLSSEVAGGFTGVMLGLYAIDKSGRETVFTDLLVEHTEE